MDVLDAGPGWHILGPHAIDLAAGSSGSPGEPRRALGLADFAQRLRPLRQRPGVRKYRSYDEMVRARERREPVALDTPQAGPAVGARGRPGGGSGDRPAGKVRVLTLWKALPYCRVRRVARKPLPKGYPGSVDTLGLELRRWRMDRGISQAKLAGFLGVSKSTVENWELGETEPASERLPAIAAILGRVAPDDGQAQVRQLPARPRGAESAVSKPRHRSE